MVAVFINFATLGDSGLNSDINILGKTFCNHIVKFFLYIFCCLADTRFLQFF